MLKQCMIEDLKNILLAADGSIYSAGAAREAIALAKACSCKLRAVSVVETNPEYEALAPKLVEKASADVHALLESIKSQASGDGVSCETASHTGEQPYQFIVDDASAGKYDIIVIGRRGRSGLKRLLMGSVTAKVIGHTPCNVLVVPRNSVIEGRHIILATDGSPNSEAAASAAVKIAKGCGAKLTAITVTGSGAPHAVEQTESSKKILNNVISLAIGAGIEAKGLTYIGRPYESIVELAKHENADLIVMGSHGKTGLSKLLMGSITERVVGLSDCAVLVVKG